MANTLLEYVQSRIRARSELDAVEITTELSISVSHIQPNYLRESSRVPMNVETAIAQNTRLIAETLHQDLTQPLQDLEQAIKARNWAVCEARIARIRHLLFSPVDAL